MTFEYLIAERTNGANPFKIFESIGKVDGSALDWSIRKMPYAQFLRSAYWFGVSHVAKSKAGMRCQVCNSANKIQVHHRTYDTHGKEHENMHDLVVLCENCHGLFHGHKDAEYQRPKRFRERAGQERIKIPRGIVLPHSPDDVKIPDGDLIVLTKALIDNCRANGSFTNATLRALGMNKGDMIKGWAIRLEGVAMPREQYRLAVEGKFIYRSGKLDDQFESS